MSEAISSATTSQWLWGLVHRVTFENHVTSKTRSAWRGSKASAERLVRQWHDEAAEDWERWNEQRLIGRGRE